MGRHQFKVFSTVGADPTVDNPQTWDGDGIILPAALPEYCRNDGIQMKCFAP